MSKKPVNEPANPDERSFRALAIVVLQGTFTDNAFRLVAWLLAAQAALAVGAAADDYRTLVGVFYTAPWIFLSLLAGQLADRFSKRSVVVGTKVAEVGVLGAGLALSFVVDPWYVALGILTFLGCRMALFGPATYAMIPELMPERKLSWANGWIDGLTFLGAIVGTSAGGAAIEAGGLGIRMPLAILLAMGVAGLVFGLGIDKLPAASPERKITPFPVRDSRRNAGEILGTRGMAQAVAGIVLWWALAALALQTAMKLAEDTLGLSGFGTSRFFIYVGVGVGFGSWLAGKLSADKIELGLVPLGAFLMGGLSMLVWFMPASELWMGLNVGLVGLFSGFFVIPLKAFVQHKARPETRGGVLGMVNFLMYSGICVSVGPVYFVLTRLLGFSAQDMFLAMGVFVVGMGVFALWTLPGASLRLILFVVTHTVYRLRVTGRVNVPEHGGGLVVCNHMSFMDGLFVIAAMDRPVRPIMFEGIYNKPLVRPFAKLSRAIPISDRMPPREVIRAMRVASEAIASGDLVLIFAEGQISRTGQLLPFRKGLERIMKDSGGAPVVPMCLDRVRGTLLSYRPDRWLQKLPSRIPEKVTISFGEPLPGNSSAPDVRKAVAHLVSEAWVHRKPSARPLHHEAFASARRHPFEKCMTDALKPEGISRLAFAGATVAAAARLRKTLAGSDMAGICLPPSIAGAVVNHAALLCGKTPVNLNYSASPDVMKTILDQCGIERVVTSKLFLEKLKTDVPGELVFVEDVLGNLTGAEKVLGALRALLVPTTAIERALGAPAKRSIDDVATIIFSSGSTGVPKGVMLSHWNIWSNMQGVSEVFALGRGDCILGILPFFHSFGTTATLFLPHSAGIRVSYWPNPMDPGGIGQVVEANRVTFLVATPTFLQAYTRRVEARQFGSLQAVLTGAEKLRPAVAQAFEEKFGVKPMEGYGSTECSPIVTLNVPDFRAPGMYQRGQKPGTIGQPLPGVTLRIVDPESREDLEPGSEGLLLVRGPNVMQGYLKMPEKTAEVLADGWYVTGDIARIDEDGFVEITDRLSRFSKIGGEMVPHIRVEEALQTAIGATEQVFAVTGVPDEKKGERLVVLHTVSEAEAKEAAEGVAKDGSLPNLWLPKPKDFIRVESIPILGTGKVDLREVKRVAMEGS